jgi:hypothetical protein
MIRHKYGAIACERDGIKFPSKLERNCFDKLKSLKSQGQNQDDNSSDPFRSARWF